MEASAAKEDMIYLTILSMLTLIISHICISETLYYAHGDQLD